MTEDNRMTRYEFWERKRLAGYGVPDFETQKMCGARQDTIVKRFERNEVAPKWRGRLKQCAKGNCRQETCSAACWFALRDLRAQLIPAAANLMFGAGLLHAITAAHPAWEQEAGRLLDADLEHIKNWAARRIGRLGDHTAIGVGAIEATLNQETDGTARWAPHLHLVTAGPTKAELGEVFSITSPKVKKGAKPVQIRRVYCLGRQIAYAVKRLPQVRAAYRDATGRQTRNQHALNPEEQLEYDLWLLRQSILDRVIFIGCSWDEGKLVAAENQSDRKHR